MENEPERKIDNFFAFGFGFELCLVPVAAVVGYALTDRMFPFKLDLFNPTWLLDGVLWGVVATAPITLVPLLATSNLGMRIVPLRDIYDRVKGRLGDALLAMSKGEILLLSAAAGVGEEILFRGVLHNEIGTYWTSFLFGALHALSLAYFALATLMSLYLGWVYDSTNVEGVPGEGHLLVPIVVHWLYDAVALFLFRRRLRADSAKEEADRFIGSPTQPETYDDDFSENH